MNPRTFARTLGIQFGYSAWTFGANLADITDEAALASPAPAGNCANWVAGHILQARGGALALLGAEMPYGPDKYRRYERYSDPVTGADGTVSLAEMKVDFEATQKPLLAGLAALDEDALAAKAPFSPSNDEKETVGSLLAGLAFHEAYHAGQLGVLRRMAGAAGAIR